MARRSTSKGPIGKSRTRLQQFGFDDSVIDLLTQSACARLGVCITIVLTRYYMRQQQVSEMVVVLSRILTDIGNGVVNSIETQRVAQAITTSGENILIDRLLSQIKEELENPDRQRTRY